MHDLSRRRAAADNRDRSRPRRAALVASLASLAVLGAGVAVANASGGGISASGGGGGTSAGSVTPGCPNKQLGRRTLKVGDCGGDVATLNWILRAKDYGEAPLADEFEDPTKAAVEAFQADADLGSDGVVDADTSRALVNAMPPQRATWYGPELLRQRDRLRPDADSRDPRRRAQDAALRIEGGAPLQGSLRPHPVIDRGPFANGAKWDLTEATAQALHFEYTDDVRVAKLGRAAK